MPERDENFEIVFERFKSAVFFEGASQEEASNLLKLVLNKATTEKELDRVRFVIGFGEVRKHYNGTFLKIMPR